MIALSANDVRHYERTCQKILELDKKIRFAGIISQMGKLIAGGERNGVKLLVSKDRHEMLFMEVALRIRMRHEFDVDLGPVNFTISHRDKVVVMSIPYKDKILYVSAENDIDLYKIPHKILEIIRRPEFL
jgi:hypothetical protein